MIDTTQPRMVATAVLPVGYLVSLIHQHLQQHQLGFEREWDRIISWCIANSLRETLTLQISEHDTLYLLGTEVYEMMRDEIDSCMFQFQDFCVSGKLGNPALPLIYFRKHLSVYLISPEA